MNLDQYLGGMVQLRLSCRPVEPLLPLLRQAGVQPCSITQCDGQTLLWVPLSQFYTARTMLRGAGYRVHIAGKGGLPFRLRRWRARRGLLLGLLLGWAILHQLLSFLWGYEVTGNVGYSDAQIIALVQSYGLRPGASSKNFDYDRIERQMLLDHKELTWIQLEPRGTTLEIALQERQQTKQESSPASLVAAADGRITELLVFRGTPLVKRGDWVTEGQVLVGGWEYPDRRQHEDGTYGPSGTPVPVRAKAVISGEQQRRAQGVCATTEQRLCATGESQTQLALVWQNRQMILTGPRQSPYAYGRQQISQHSLLSFRGLELPVYVRTTRFSQRQLRQMHYTGQEAFQLAVERARRRLQSQLPAECRYIRESIGLIHSNDAAVQVEVVWTVEDGLAQSRTVALPPPEPEDTRGTVWDEK